MKKKIVVACLALAAFAAFASTASASPVLKEGGIPIATGTAVTAQSEGTIYRTNAVGNYTCGESDMQGTVVKNNGFGIEIQFNAVTFSGSGFCDWQAAKLPWCLRVGAEPAHSFTLDGGKCGESPKPITLTAASGFGYSCDYPSEGAITGTYSTGTLGANLTTGVERFDLGTGFCRAFDLDPIKYHLSTATSPFARLTIS